MSEQQQIQLVKTFVKDSSFSVKKPFHLFSQDNWKPNLQVNFDSAHISLPEDNSYDVSFILKVTVSSQEEIAFDCEVHYNAIVAIQNFSDEQKDHALGAYVPSIIYPFACEVLADYVTKSGFPQLCLSPVNFDVIYQEKKSQKQN